MTEARDQLRHELAALLATINSIAEPCISPTARFAYTSASEKFREHIEELWAKTQIYLQNFPPNSEDIEESEEDFGSPPQDLQEIKYAWKELHPYIRPVIQADTLHQPTSLLDALTKRFRQIPEFNDTVFTVFHTEKFNYLHLFPNEIARVTEKLGRLVGAKPFPPLGLIGVPSSQSSSLFLNCLIAHEMGHYAASKRRFRLTIQGEAEASIEIHLKERVQANQDLFWKRLAGWAEELFCDLFAIMLIGPCYTFAYIELYDQLHLLKFDGSLHPERKSTGLAFNPFSTHPPHLFRICKQAALLRDLGWWDSFQKLSSRHVALLNKLLGITDDEHAGKDNDNALIVKSFQAIIPEVDRILAQVTAGLDSGVHEFRLLDAAITDYLQRGLVPSMLNVERFGEVEVGVQPSAISLLNSGAKFYLEHMDTLSDLVADYEPESVEKRAFWIRRLESWITKALEDISLDERESYGSSNKGDD